MNPDTRPGRLLYRRELTGAALITAAILTRETDPRNAFVGAEIAREGDPKFESFIELYFSLERHRLIHNLAYADPNVGGIWLPDQNRGTNSIHLRVEPRINKSSELKHALTVITANYPGKISQNPQNPRGWRILAIAKGMEVKELDTLFNGETYGLQTIQGTNISFDVTAINRTGQFFRKLAPNGTRPL